MDLRELRAVLDAQATAVPEPVEVKASTVVRIARQRRRWRRIGIALSVAAIAAVVGTSFRLAATDTSPTGRVEVTEPSTTLPMRSSPAATPGRVRTLTFTGAFIPQQVVSDGGKVWVVGSTPPTNGGGCAVEEVDAVTLRTHLFRVPGCGPMVAVGKAHLYLIAVAYVNGTSDTKQIRLVSFDTATGRATAMRPVDATLYGSEIAHATMTYGIGSLWLYGYATSPGSRGVDVVQISPTTGAVIRTITGVPDIGGTQPAIAANQSGLWLGGGAGGPPNLDWLAPGSRTLSTVYTAPNPGSILWLSAVDNKVWAVVATYKNNGQVILIQLIAFDASGKKVVKSPLEQLGDGPLVGSGDRLWSVGVGSNCKGPQRVWAVDGSTGKSVVVTTLRSPIEPCLTEGNGSQLAVVGRSVFVLDATGAAIPASVLFRIDG